MHSTHIQGIPCLINVTSYYPGYKGWYDGPPERCYPDEPEEIEWEVRDRKGYQAPWLERKLTKADRIRIENELLAGRSEAYNDYLEEVAERQVYGYFSEV